MFSVKSCITLANGDSTTFRSEKMHIFQEGRKRCIWVVKIIKLNQKWIYNFINFFWDLYLLTLNSELPINISTNAYKYEKLAILFLWKLYLLYLQCIFLSVTASLVEWPLITWWKMHSPHLFLYWCILSSQLYINLIF